MPQETVNLAANAQQNLSVSGKFVTVVSCTGTFQIELDNTGRRDVAAGTQIGEKPFKKITFLDTSGATNRVVVDVSDNPSPNLPIVQSQVTATVAVPIPATSIGTTTNAYNIPSGTPVLFLGVVGGKNRKTIRIKHSGYTNAGVATTDVLKVELSISVGVYHWGLGLDPGESVQIDTTADVKISSLAQGFLGAAAGNVLFFLTEIFYA